MARERRPASSSRRVAANQVAAPALEGADRRLGLAPAGRGHHLGQVVAGRHQLVGQAGVQRPGPDQGLGQGDGGHVGRVGVGPLDHLGGQGLGGRPAGHGSHDGVGPAAQGRRLEAADALQGRGGRRPALGHLDQGGVAQHRGHRAVLGGGGLLPPGGQLAGDRPGPRVQLGHPGEPLPGQPRVTLIGRLLQAPALLPRPLEAAAGRQPLLEGVGQSRWATSSRA